MKQLRGLYAQTFFTFRTSLVRTVNRLLPQLMQLFLIQKRIINLWISECNVFPLQWINSGRICSIPGNL